MENIELRRKLEKEKKEKEMEDSDEHLQESKVLTPREKQLKTRHNNEIHEMLESRHYEYYE